MKLFVILTILMIGSTSLAHFKVMLEGGALWQNRNDVAIPGETGDRLEFDQFGEGPSLHYRAEIFYNFSENHNFRMVYAPFNVVVDGPISRNISFNNQVFTPGQDLEVDYTFNSYRLTYFYSFWGNKDSQLNLGVTAKIRDAEIIFSQGGQVAAYDNLGFVPLIYFEYQTNIGKNWLFNFNMDAAGASQGRAIDVALKVRRRLSQSTQVGFGYRTLEGGADNEEVFTFSWFNYATIDLVSHF